MKNSFFLVFSALFFLTIAGESALARRGSSSGEDSAGHHSSELHSSGNHTEGHRRGRGCRSEGRGRGRDSRAERLSHDNSKSSHR